MRGGNGPRVGICCSGGGIRAASFALGALQVLQKNRMLHGESKARYLSAVSGGSYIVGGMSSVQRSIEAGDGSPEVPAFSADSPEERRLRNRLAYLTHGPGGLPGAVWRLLLGILVNVVLLGSTVIIAAVVAGWIYGEILPQLRWYYGDKHAGHRYASTKIVPPTWLLVGLLVFLGVAVLLGLVSVIVRRSWSATGRAISGALVVLVGVVAVFALGLPQLLGWLHRTSVVHHDQLGGQTSASLPWWSLSGLAVALAGAITAAAPVWRVVRTGLTEIDKQPSWVRRFLGRIRKPLLNLLATIAGPLLVIVAFVWFAKGAAADPPFQPFSGGRAVGVWASLLGVSALVLVLAWWFADLNAWSLHALYEERLSDAFGLRRCRRDEGDPSTAVGSQNAVPRQDPLRLSQSQPQNFPEVLICATANVPEYGVAPTSRGATSFVFTAAEVEGDAEFMGTTKTADYEERGFPHPTDLSLMTAVSISGAAVAPEMGKMTRRPLRFLLALANVRLGVWLPKPKSVDRIRGGPTPGLSYLLLHEMLGMGGRKDSFAYVTDGGHYDNLGLVELLDRRCDWIWCIDASGDAIDTFSTLGGALAMAEAELGVKIDIRPDRDMAPRPAGSRYVQRPFCRGSIAYPPRGDEKAKEGTLVVIKTGVPRDAPWSIRSYHADHRNFPCDPTLDQLYTADRFNAYVELGRYSMQCAWREHGADLEAGKLGAVNP